MYFPQWHFHLSQARGPGLGSTLLGNDQAIAEGTSQEGCWKPHCLLVPLQMPGNAVAYAQEESPELPLLRSVAWAAGVQYPPVALGVALGLRGSLSYL